MSCKLLSQVYSSELHASIMKIKLASKIARTHSTFFTPCQCRFCLCFPFAGICVNPPFLLSHYYYLQSFVSLSFLGETLRCKSCFSRESLKDCLETAKSRPCAKNEVLCMLHQTVTTKRGRYYFEHCATKTFYKFRWESCNNPTRAIVNDARLGNVTCSIHCTGGDCSDENMSLLSFLRR